MVHLVVLPIGCIIPLPIIGTAVQSNYLKAFTLPFVFSLVATLFEASGPGVCAKPDPVVLGKTFASSFGGMIIFFLLAGFNTV